MKSFTTLPTSLDVIRVITLRRMRWVWHIPRTGEIRNAYRILVGKPEGKRPLGRPRRRWEDNIRTCVREIGYEVVDRMYLA
jgi:hypothetical protein